MEKDFQKLGLASGLVENLTTMGLKTPTAVQAEAIPLILAGKNLLVQSPTGTGKTLAYLLPLLTRLNGMTKDLELLVLVPSRELAFQVTKVIKSLDEKLGVSVLTGGANVERQIQSLKDKPKVAVGTPGRVLELFGKKKINGQTIQTIVIDETDKMFSAGFMADVLQILKKTLRSRQVLFFSATMPRHVVRQAGELITPAPEFILIDSAGSVPPQIKHHYIRAEKTRKLAVLDKLLRIYQPQKAMVFMERNEGVTFMTQYLKEQGYGAGGLHSDLSEQKRKNLLTAFREGRISLLVTTDLLARGMDVADIDYIFNYDLPRDTKQYLHRVGRTGRAGKEGTAVTLVSEQQKFIFYKIGRDLKIILEEMGVDEKRVFPVRYRKRRRPGSLPEED
jgi:ATP-dependent RNA helicase DeaD